MKFNRTPLTLDVEQWNGSASDAGRIRDWLLSDHPGSLIPTFVETNETTHRQHNEIHIETPAGTSILAPGDHIAVGPTGHVFRVPAEVLQNVYDAETADKDAA